MSANGIEESGVALTETEFVMKRIDDLRADMGARFNGLKEDVDQTSASVNAIAASQTRLELESGKIASDVKSCNMKLDMVSNQATATAAASASPLEVQQNSKAITAVDTKLDRCLTDLARRISETNDALSGKIEKHITWHTTEDEKRKTRRWDILVRVMTSSLVLTGAIQAAIWFFAPHARP